MSPVRWKTFLALVCFTAITGPFAHTTNASPRITEFMANNATTLTDGDGDSSDWIEIHNPTDHVIDLHGYHLTDDLDRLTRWAFPATTFLNPNGYLIVFASGKFPNGRPTNSIPTFVSTPAGTSSRWSPQTGPTS